MYKIAVVKGVYRLYLLASFSPKSFDVFISQLWSYSLSLILSQCLDYQTLNCSVISTFKTNNDPAAHLSFISETLLYWAVEKVMTQFYIEIIEKYMTAFLTARLSQISGIKVLGFYIYFSNMKIEFQKFF